MVLCQGCTITPIRYLVIILFYILYANIQTEEYFIKIDMIREFTNKSLPTSTEFDKKTTKLSKVKMHLYSIFKDANQQWIKMHLLWGYRYAYFWRPCICWRSYSCFRRLYLCCICIPEVFKNTVRTANHFLVLYWLNT